MQVLYNQNSTQYSSISDMVNGTDSNGNANFGLTINPGAGYVNSGWSLAMNSSGIIEGNPQGGPMDDMFTYNQILNGVLTVSESLLLGNPLLLTENTQGLIDSAYDRNIEFATQTDFIPTPEPTSMALMALGIAAFGLKRKKPKYMAKEDVKV